MIAKWRRPGHGQLNCEPARGTRGVKSRAALNSGGLCATLKKMWAVYNTISLLIQNTLASFAQITSVTIQFLIG